VRIVSVGVTTLLFSFVSSTRLKGAMNTRLGEGLTVRGLQSLHQRVLRGRAPQVMVIVGDVYALFPAEEIVAMLGVSITETLGHPPSSLGP